MQRGGRPPFAEARLTHDPQLRLEVEAARSWGVPHSILTGRTVREGQPLWTAQDTALAVALTAVEAATCSCGHDRRESMAPANEYAYTAEAVRCHACATRDRAADNYAKADGSMAGLAFRVVKKEATGGG